MPRDPALPGPDGPTGPALRRGGRHLRGGPHRAGDRCARPGSTRQDGLLGPALPHRHVRERLRR